MDPLLTGLQSIAEAYVARQTQIPAGEVAAVAADTSAELHGAPLTVDELRAAEHAILRYYLRKGLHQAAPARRSKT